MWAPGRRETLWTWKCRSALSACRLPLCRPILTHVEFERNKIVFDTSNLRPVLVTPECARPKCATWFVCIRVQVLCCCKHSATRSIPRACFRIRLRRASEMEESGELSSGSLPCRPCMYAESVIGSRFNNILYLMLFDGLPAFISRGTTKLRTAQQLECYEINPAGLSAGSCEDLWILKS